MANKLTIALRQIKLTSGDEIVCEILDYGYGEEDDVDNFMAVRNPFRLVAVESPRDNVRYYAFRPFMMYQGDGEHVQMLNPSHVVSECTPTRHLIEEYMKAVDDHNSAEETQVLKSLDETKKAMNEYYDKVQEEAIKRYRKTHEYDEITFDSGGEGNIIKFPGDGTMH